MWYAVHCESVVAYSSHAVQIICGRPLYMNYMTSENRLSPENQARASSFEKQQATRYPENSLFFCGCVVSTPPPCLSYALVQATAPSKCAVFCAIFFKKKLPFN